MIPGMNSRDMQRAMKRMGIQQEDVDAVEVIIKRESHSLIIRNPQVTKVNMMGQETFQITGAVEEYKECPSITDADIQAVVDQTGCSSDKAKELLKETGGDIAEAIIKLQGE